jgi:hypothetical protein
LSTCTASKAPYALAHRFFADIVKLDGHVTPASRCPQIWRLVNAAVTFYYHYGALYRYIAATMSIAIADALLIEAAIFLSIGVIVGFVLCAKFVQKDPWTSGM